MDEERARQEAQAAAAALAALALVSPAALGGIPVLPVTIDDERRRQQDEVLQESDSSVGVYQEVQEAETALTLSQRRLAAVTREVRRDPSRNVCEQDVVEAARLVRTGMASPGQGRRFRAALGSVANDSVDLFILQQQEEQERLARAAREDDEAGEDLEAWLEEFA